MKRILHLSDPHFGAEDPAVVAAFLAALPGLSPDITILSGDLTMRARRSELLRARSFADVLPPPLFVIPGNHDIPALNQPFERFFTPFRRYRDSIHDELEPVFRQPGLLVVGVNSSKPFGLHRDWSTGHLGPHALDKLGARLDAAGPGDLRVLVMHHPLIAPANLRREVVSPLDDLLETTSGRKVDLILCGHFHRSHIATAGAADSWKSVVSQAATVCSLRLQGEAQGFHLLTAGGDHIRIERHRYDGSAFRAGEIIRFNRQATGWETDDTAVQEVEPG